MSFIIRQMSHCSIFFFLVVFCRQLFVLFFRFVHLLRFLITPLLSLSFSPYVCFSNIKFLTRYYVSYYVNDIFIIKWSHWVYYILLWQDSWYFILQDTIFAKLWVAFKSTTDDDWKQTPRQTWWLHFSNSQLPFHHKQYSNITRV